MNSIDDLIEKLREKRDECYIDYKKYKDPLDSEAYSTFSYVLTLVEKLKKNMEKENERFF